MKKKFNSLIGSIIIILSLLVRKLLAMIITDAAIAVHAIRSHVIIINILYILIHVTNEKIRKFVLFYLKNLTSTKQQIVCFNVSWAGCFFFLFQKYCHSTTKKLITIEVKVNILFYNYMFISVQAFSITISR